MTHRIVVVASLLLSTAALAAQSERITVHLAPAPNQTVRLRTTQDMVMTIETDGPAGNATAAIPTNMHALVETTSAVGPADHDGHYSAKSATVPTALNLPLPGGGPAIPLGIAGETTYTLTSVTFDGADRIAHLTSRASTTMTQGSTTGAGSPFPVDMRITSDGKMDVNVDRGIVLHTEQRSTIDGQMRAGANGSAMPTIRQHGTITLSSDVVK